MASKKSRRTIKVKPSLNFPFLYDEKTVEYIKKSKVMFIMRGLPGSGKSTVAMEISKVYKDAVICSADEYFIEEGQYKFDHDKLSEAHDFCHKQTQMAIDSGHYTIIIDNTNIRKWEMKYYVDLAAEYNYTVVTVLPKTTWRWNCEVLAKLNSHCVTKEYLEDRKKSFDRALPCFYGWMVNHTDSKKLIDLGKQCFNQCVEKMPKFVEHMERALEMEEGSKVKYDKCFSRHSSSTEMVHCTAFFAQFGKTRSSHDYISMVAVKQSLGKLFKLCVIGIVITPRTIGARVRLTDQQLQLWGKDDGEAKNSPCKTGNASASPKDVEMLVKDKNSLAYRTLQAMGMTTDAEEKGDAADYVKSRTRQKQDKRKEKKHIQEIKEREEEAAKHNKDGCLMNEQPEVADTWEDLLEEEENLNTNDMVDKEEPNNERLDSGLEQLDDHKSEQKKDSTKETPELSHPTDTWVNLSDTSEKMVSERLENLQLEKNERKTDIIIMEGDKTTDKSDTDEESIEVEIDDEEEQEPIKNRFNPTSGLGSRAHITLGYSRDYNAVQTGIDLIDVIDCEEEMIHNTDHITFKGGAIRWYGQGRCVIYFDKPITISTLFSGKY